MRSCLRGILKFTSVCLAILTVCGSKGFAAAGPQSEQLAQPPAEEEATQKKPTEKPEELPAYLLPRYYPGLVPFAPYTTTFAPVPSVGFSSPYGYSGADDTLLRGWHYHPLGPVRFSPYLEYDGLFRTNVFQTYSNKQSDFVNVINPGLYFELPVHGQHKISVGYLGNAFLYSRYGELDHFDQNVNANAALNFSKLSVRVGSAFRAATEEPSAFFTPTSLTIGRERFYYRTTPYLEAAYKMADRWRVDAQYQFDNLSFPKRIDRFDDYQYNTLSGTVFYKFWPKTSALLQYVAVIRGHPYDSTRNNVVHTPLVGLTWSPTAKLSGTVKFGYTIANYDQTLPGRNSSPNSWALSIQTLYKISRFTQLSLIAQRGIQEDSDFANEAYINSGLFLTLSHYWHYFKVTSYAAFSYYNNDYLFSSTDPITGESLKRNDNYASAGFGLSRPITRWLRVRVDYLYSNRGSNFSQVAYNEHQLMFGLQSSF